MRLYLDDDVSSSLLTRLLRAAGHDVRLPADLGLAGAKDPVHLTRAIREDRVLLSRNYSDFEDLHDLVHEAKGHHLGILVIRRDDHTKRNLAPRDVVRAVGNLLAAGVPVADQYTILNHWQ